MPFETGHTKVGGRKPGTPNVITRDVRHVLKTLVNSELSTLHERLQLMTPEDRTAVLLKLIPFVLPSLDKVSHTFDEGISWDL
jgi:hypothetical protein